MMPKKLTRFEFLGANSNKFKSANSKNEEM